MKYPIGIQNFEKLRREGYAYVDKTVLMFKMVSEGSYYFLSRPRRFGKSLMISTLEAFFNAKRELFKGLYADSVDWDWQQYPVMHLDLNTGKYDATKALDDMLEEFLARQEALYGHNEHERSFGLRFQGVLRRAFEKTGRPVVVLVDEYDKPMLQAIGDDELQTYYRNTLKAFYGALNSIDIMDTNPLPLLYQSGYLTLKSYNERFDEYRLGFPNREVEQGFIKYLLPFYTPKTEDKKSYLMARFIKDIEGGNAEGFMQRLESFFATGDYQVVGEFEKYFQNTLYVFFRLMGFYVEVERHTTNGRMDIVIQTPNYIYILELKIDKTAKEALQQIEEKEYAIPFSEDHRQLFKIGVNFSSATRRVDGWLIQ